MINSYADYAHLLSELSWNNRSRKREGCDLLNKMMAILQSHPQLTLQQRQLHKYPAPQGSDLPYDYVIPAHDTPGVPQWLIDAYAP